MNGKNIPRREAIPILYTRGTHYDVGFDMGRTFGSIIKNFLLISDPLNTIYLPLYSTEKGKNAYNETLESVKKSFPQYIRELEGIADGAQVEFHKLFLLHMDDILPQSLEHSNENKVPTGCSSILLNTKKTRALGHTEDALTETLNHYYFVVAHIISDSPQGKYNVKEERFMSLCYAGHLPGYTMNYNHHGLVFSINTLSAKYLKSGKTPRHFITRALLSAENYDQALKIINDDGVGAGDGCSINMAFLNDETFYNIEMAPAIDGTAKSRIDIKEIRSGEHNYHTNKYQRIKIDEVNEEMQVSSITRMETLNSCPVPQNVEDITHMLGECSEGVNSVFVEDNTPDEPVKTICVGIFDLNNKTLALYADNPREHAPLAVLPLMLKN